MSDQPWTTDDLDRIGNAEELQLASRRADGSLRTFVVMWVIRVGDSLYVRSAGGPARAWYRAAVTSGVGRIRAGGIERDVTFEVVPDDPAGDTRASSGTRATSGAHAAIDAAYHAKYDRYGPRIVGSVVGPAAHAVTIRLRPAELDATGGRVGHR